MGSAASSPEGFVGFIQRLLAGEAKIPEQMRIFGERTQRRALPLPGPPAAQRTPAERERTSPIYLMKSSTRLRRLHDQGWHRQVPKAVKCSVEASIGQSRDGPQSMLSLAGPSFSHEVTQCDRAFHR
jgi:hypothetical protein